jgi:Predicted thioesterase
MIKIGMVNEKTAWVTRENTAEAMGSGTLPVFATPTMILLMEQTASECVAPYLQEGESSVGTSLNVKHTAPTLVGSEVRCRAELTEIDRSKLVFRVSVCDRTGEIGSGTHERFIVKAEKFMAKAEERNIS